MSRKNCLDNPTLPHKIFRDVLVKRLRRDRSGVHQSSRSSRLPIVESWERFKSDGRIIAADTACTYKEQLGEALLLVQNDAPNYAASRHVRQVCHGHLFTTFSTHFFR